jgi:hypothetical protein
MGYPTRNAGKPGPHIRAQDEKLQGLIGGRGKDGAGHKAVTHGDAAELGTIAIASQKVTAAPTAAQFNALVDDVHALATVLNAMGAKFTGL